VKHDGAVQKYCDWCYGSLTDQAIERSEESASRPRTRGAAVPALKGRPIGGLRTAGVPRAATNGHFRTREKPVSGSRCLRADRGIMHVIGAVAVHDASH